TGAALGGPVAPAGVLSWTKRLSPSDAQQVGSGTNPTGKLRLAKADNPIDHKTWFRETFFEDENWTTQMRNGRPYEVASVDFDISIGGSSIGTRTLIVDHAPHRVASQNNVPTV